MWLAELFYRSDISAYRCALKSQSVQPWMASKVREKVCELNHIADEYPAGRKQFLSIRLALRRAPTGLPRGLIRLFGADPDA